MLTDFVLMLMMGLSCLVIYAVYKWNLPKSTYVLTTYKVPSQGGDIEQTSLRKLIPPKNANKKANILRS